MTTSKTNEATQFQQAWREWHAAREAALRVPHGWLSLTGLHWLDRESGRFEELPGRWWFDEEGTWFEPEGDSVFLDGAELTRRALVADPSGRGVGHVTTGDRVLEIFGRGDGNRGVRVRDPHAPSRVGFRGVPVFEPDPAWRILARYTALPEQVSVSVGTASPRVWTARRVVGHVAFTYDGSEHRLAVSDGPGLSIAFLDATSGTQTFALLRQLSIDPAIDGTVLLDFNRAINPPSAFSDFGTCPLPVPDNVLKFPVLAGERTPLRPAV